VVLGIHPRTVRSRHGAGDHAAAREACAQAVRHLAATLGDSHPSLAEARALAALLGQTAHP